VRLFSGPQTIQADLASRFTSAVPRLAGGSPPGVYLDLSTRYDGLSLPLILNRYVISARGWDDWVGHTDPALWHLKGYDTMWSGVGTQIA